VRVWDDTAGYGIDSCRSQRNLAIDWLRGLCLVLMTVDHLPGNVLARYSNSDFGPFGFFTAAPGFVFLSGFVCGHVYGKHRQTHGDWSVAHRVLRRMSQIYAVQLALLFTLLLAFSGHVRGTSNLQGADLFQTHPSRAFFMGASLLYQPAYLDILPMYCFFLILTPLLLWQLQEGPSWRVLSCSGALALLAGLAVHLPRNPLGLNFGASSPFTQQFVFVVGMTLSVKRVRLGGFRPFVRRLLVTACVSLTFLFLVIRWCYALVPPFRAVVDRLSLFGAPALGPLRFLSFAAFVVAVTWALEKSNSIKAKNMFSRNLVMLGQHSLVVFGWSIMITFAATMLFPNIPSRHWRSAELGLALASLFAVARFGVAMRARDQRVFKGISREPASAQPNP
jgi:hypothetical protein